MLCCVFLSRDGNSTKPCLQEPGAQDEQQLQASMAQAALMHQMQTQYQSYFQQCVQSQQAPPLTPGQEQLQQLLMQQRRQSPAVPTASASDPQQQ